jgi:FKBP-type peptidyl-prolyl cis-trans isomerase FklB
MKKLWMASVCATFVIGAAGAQDKLDLTDQSRKTAYSVGYQIGADMHRQGIQLDPEALAAGARDAGTGAEPRVNREEMRSLMTEMQKRVQEGQKKTRDEAAAKNLADGEAFLAQNGKKAGVVTLPSGLQYQILKDGQGEAPQASDTVTVHYVGTLIDGTEFDSSRSRGQPASFRLDRVIKGWTEAVQLMKPGAKWKLFVPPKLGYGERGAGAKIGPNATLIFEVELISAKKSEEK